MIAVADHAAERARREGRERRALGVHLVAEHPEVPGAEAPPFVGLQAQFGQRRSGSSGPAVGASWSVGHRGKPRSVIVPHSIRAERPPPTHARPTPSARRATDSPARPAPTCCQHADNPVDWYPWGPEALERAARRGQAHPAVDRLLGLPLVPRHGARVVRGRGHRGAHERAVREREGGPRGTPRPRPHLPDRAPDAHAARRRLAAHHVPLAARPPAVLRRHVFPARAEVTACPPSARCCTRVAQYYREHGEEIRRQGDALVEVFGQLLPAPALAPARRCRARPLAAARDALAARLRRALRRLRRRAEVPAPDEPRVPAAHVARVGRRGPARPAGALHGHAHAHAHGRGRPLRPARRRLLPLLGGRVLDDPALREDAVRQRPAAGGERAGGRRHRRPAVPTRDRRDRRLDPPRHGASRTAATTRRSTPTPRATRASSTSGRRTRRAPCSTSASTRCSRGASGSTATPTSRDAGTCTPSSRWPRSRRRPGWTKPRPRRRSTPRARSCSRCATVASGPAATRRSSPAGTASRSPAWRPRARALDRADCVESAARAVAFLREHCWYDGPAARGAQGRPLALPGLSRRPRLPRLGPARAAAGALARAVARVGGRARRRDARAFRGPRGRRLLLHRRRPRIADPSSQDLRRRRDARGQRRRRAPAAAPRLPARRAALPRRRRADAARCVVAHRTLPARAHEPADGARRIHRAARRGRAARPRGRRRRLARRARQALRPAPRGVRDSVR